MIKKTLLAVFLLLFLVSPAFAELKVVTTLPWIGSLAKEIGGDKITGTTLVKPNQDPHYIEAKPSMILAARKADIIMYNGLDLEAGYLPVIIESSKNTRIQPGEKGNLNCGQFVNAIERPSTVDRSQGDVHPLGNPHYHLSPSNMAHVAEGIADALVDMDNNNAAFYRANLASFNKRLEEKRKEWNGKLRGKRFLTFHKYFEYLANDLGFRITGYIEPKPGIPPSSGHMARLIETISKDRPEAILSTSYYGKQEVEFLSSKTGVKGIVVPHEIGCQDGINDWFVLMDRVVESLR